MSNDKLIETLQESIKLKDDQIKTIRESLQIKDQHIETLESSIESKKEKIRSLEKTIELKEDQIQEAKENSVQKSVLREKEQEIEELQNKVDLLEEELIKADEDLEMLEKENEKLRSKAGSPDTKIVDYSNINIPRDEIIEQMQKVLQGAMHSVSLAVPTIMDLQDLYLYEIKSSVSIKASCWVNAGNKEHLEFLEELEGLGNISIRSYEGKDRYVLLRDGEELLFSIIGNDEANNLTFQTRDSKHINLLNSLVMETWLRSRKI
jgi:DNA repair exonuclease SbcCD ATPase subunit